MAVSDGEDPAPGRKQEKHTPEEKVGRMWRTLRSGGHSLVCIAAGVTWVLSVLVATVFWGLVLTSLSEYSFIAFGWGLVVIALVPTTVAVASGLYAWMRCGRRWP